jgi:hypothetical protein
MRMVLGLNRPTSGTATNRISVSRVDEVLDVGGLESVADKNAETLGAPVVVNRRDA